MVHFFYWSLKKHIESHQPEKFHHKGQLRCFGAGGIPGEWVAQSKWKGWLNDWEGLLPLKKGGKFYSLSVGFQDWWFQRGHSFNPSSVTLNLSSPHMLPPLPQRLFIQTQLNCPYVVAGRPGWEHFHPSKIKGGGEVKPWLQVTWACPSWCSAPPSRLSC